MNNPIIDYGDIAKTVNKIPFYLLITINILIIAAFCVATINLIYQNIELTKDAVYSIELLMEQYGNSENFKPCP